MRRRIVIPGALALTLAFVVGCGGGETDEPASSLSKAEHDSVLADSPLPGAGAVRGALDVADSASARARRLDEASRR